MPVSRGSGGAPSAWPAPRRRGSAGGAAQHALSMAWRAQLTLHTMSGGLTHQPGRACRPMASGQRCRRRRPAAAARPPHGEPPSPYPLPYLPQTCRRRTKPSTSYAPPGCQDLRSRHQGLRLPASAIRPPCLRRLCDAPNRHFAISSGWGRSSNGRAPASHAGGTGIDTRRLQTSFGFFCEPLHTTLHFGPACCAAVVVFFLPLAPPQRRVPGPGATLRGDFVA